jgi:hypothetical protein
MSGLEVVFSNFNNEYNKLDIDTQKKLDDFIAGIEEVGSHFSNGINFTYDEELLDKFLPSLKTICSTLSSKKSISDQGDVILELNWEPNNFIIPPDVIVRTTERYNNMNSSQDDEYEPFPLLRTASSSIVYNQENTDNFAS